MSRCLELAKRGMGFVNPNPLVGCVIVHENKIISEGWHVAIGQAHAERMAILALVDRSILRDSELYVNLEPCSHFGKTPPCADLIVEHQFRKVYVGFGDPNPLVSGSGIKRLLEHGIKVETNILVDECRALNRFFYKFHTEKRPFVTLKWAQSKDGFLAPLPLKRFQISGVGSSEITHSLRLEHSAILVGVDTWIVDKPLLNNRLYEGPSPKKFILDPNLRGEYSSDLDMVVFNKTKTERNGLLCYVQIEEPNMIKGIMNYLYEHQLNSLMVEGGSKTLQSFIDAQLADEIHVFQSKDITIHNGVNAPIHHFVESNSVQLPADIYSIYHPQK